MNEITMDPTTSRPQPVCPPGFTECQHATMDPPGTVMHYGPNDTANLYNEACELIDVQIQPRFWDKAPEWIGTDPADLERPYVEVTVAPDDVQLHLNPHQARALAAALHRAADAADPAPADASSATLKPASTTPGTGVDPQQA